MSRDICIGFIFVLLMCNSIFMTFRMLSTVSVQLERVENQELKQNITLALTTVLNCN